MKVKNPDHNMINLSFGMILHAVVSELEIEYSKAPVLKDGKSEPGYVLTGIKSIKFKIKER